MIKISVKLCLGAYFLSFTTLSFADHRSLKKFEKQILVEYKDADFFEVNSEVETKILDEISLDSSSFSYEFPNFKKAGFIHIHYSPDKKLKFYSFDVSGGGTMGEWSNYVQYSTGNQLHLDEFDAGDPRQNNGHPVPLKIT